MRVVPQIEAKLKPFGARPHWAKVFTMDAREIAPLYPRMGEFREMVRGVDAKGKFENRYLAEHVDEG
jgi:xylitol oxidase